MYIYIYTHTYTYIHHISQDIPRILVGEFLYTNTQQPRCKLRGDSR